MQRNPDQEEEEEKKALQLLEKASENAERLVKERQEALARAGVSFPPLESNVDEILATAMALKVSMVQKRVMEWSKQMVKEHGASILPRLATVILATRISRHGLTRECPYNWCNYRGDLTLSTFDEVKLTSDTTRSNPHTDLYNIWRNTTFSSGEEGVVAVSLYNIWRNTTFSSTTLEYVLRVVPIVLLFEMVSFREGSYGENYDGFPNQCLRELLSFANEITLEEAIAILEIFAPYAEYNLELLSLRAV